MIETYLCLRDTCIDEMKDQRSPFYFQESVTFIERVKETRHHLVLKRQLSKFDQLWQRVRGGCSKQVTTSSNQVTTNGCSSILYREQG